MGPEVRVQFVAGTGMGGAPTPGVALTSRISSAYSQAIDSKGNVYSADYNQSAIEKISPDGTLTVVTGLRGTGAPVPGPATNSPMPWPTSVAVDANDHLYISSGTRIYTVDPDTGTLSVFAGNGTNGTPVNGPATSSPIGAPGPLAFDEDGTLWFPDTNSRRLLKVDTDGQLEIVAGDGSFNDPPVGPVAGLGTPIGSGLNDLAIDSEGDVYWTTGGGPGFVAKYDVEDHTIERVAGNGSYNSPQDGPALQTTLGYPTGLAITADDSLILGSSGEENCVVMMITPGGDLTKITSVGCGPPAEGLLDDTTLYDSRQYIVDDAGTLWAGTGSPRLVKVTGIGPVATVKNVVADPGNAQATLTFSPPTNGSSGLAGYETSIDEGQTWQPFNPMGTVEGDLRGLVTGLQNGVSNGIRVRAVSARYGPGEETAVKVTPEAAPASAPRFVNAEGKDRSADVTFTEPLDDGGSPIDHYEYQLVSETGWLPATTAPAPGNQLSLNIPGLVNGHAYEVKVRAVTLGAAPGQESFSAYFTPVSAPAAPTAISATRGDTRATIVFTVPDDGGSPILRYEVSHDNGASWDFVSTEDIGGNQLRSLVEPLDNGTTYVLRVRAVNDAGNGADAALPPVTPATIPGEPQDFTAEPGDGSIAISLKPPTDDGGDAVTGYKLSIDNGSTYNTVALASGPNGTLTATIPNLDNGLAYYLRVRAVNGVGDGMVGQTQVVTPAKVPGAPSDVTIDPANGKASITATLTDGGGIPLTGMEASTDGGAHWVTLTGLTPVGPNRLEATLSPLINGTSYDVIVRARNAVGPGPASPAVPVTPGPVAPDAPSGLDALPGNGLATLRFAPPADAGGSPVTRYEYTADGGQTWHTLATEDSGHGLLRGRVAGLTNGTPYTFAVRAVNAVGESAASDPASATPAAVVPTAPANLEAASGDGSAKLTFAPSDDGGSPILRYEYTLDGGTNWHTLADDRRVTGLTNRMTYQLRLRAVNTVGAGAESAPVTLTPYVVTPATAPIAAAGVSSVTASWPKPVPADDITGYTAYAHPGPSTCSTERADDTSCVLGAEAGTTYTVTVVAHGANGVDAPASAPSNPVTPTAPAAPPAPPEDAPVTLTTDQGPISLAVPAQKITVIGTGFAKHSTAKVVIYSDPIELGTVTTDADGSFSMPVTVPESLHAGTHTFLATGVDHLGRPRAMKLPVTVPPTAVKTSDAGDGNSTQLPIPVGGSIVLLDGAGAPATSVTMPGQGTYLLDAATGTITFVAAKGFVGTANAVTYRITDAIGSSVTGTYAAVVTKAATDPVVAPPAPAGAGAGRPGVKKTGRVVASGDKLGVTCTLSGGAIERCATTVYAKVGGRLVVAGKSKPAKAAATREAHALRTGVVLNAIGRSLIARPGGASLTARAAIGQRGVDGQLSAHRTVRVVAKRFPLARVVRFATDSARVKPADRRYLAAVRRQLAGARTVTCTGNTDSRGEHNLPLGRQRAAAVCRLLTAGTKVRAKLVSRADLDPRASNATSKGRALNRRATISVGY